MDLECSNGSAIRTFQTNQDFNLAVCFWKQDGQNKIPEISQMIEVSKETWNIMKGNLTDKIMERLEMKLKSFGVGKHQEARLWYKKINRRYLSKFDTKFKINFKVDSKKQRRIQCSFDYLELCLINNDIVATDNFLNLQIVESKSRTFNK